MRTAGGAGTSVEAALALPVDADAPAVEDVCTIGVMTAGGPAGASGTLTLAYCGADSPRTVPFTLSGDPCMPAAFSRKVPEGSD